MKRSKKRLRLVPLAQLSGVVLLVLVVFVSMWQLKAVREFFGQASGTPANIVIDASAVSGPIKRPWRNLAQGGEESNWRMTGFAPVVKSLSPEYIRIDHIYSFYEVVKRDGDKLVFDFSRLDPLLSDIVSVGAIPYIALSYMPSELSSSDIVGAPRNWNEYQLLIQRTIEHISGTRKIANVYYEVWNEPDLFGAWKTYGEKNYLTLYTYAAKGAADAQNVEPFKFGGPGITALYENWFTRLSDHALANNLRYDFFSWHRYDQKLTQFTDDYQKAAAWKARYPQLSTLELHVTEWGHDSRNHPGYDSSFGAAHTVAAAIEMIGKVDRGFVFEIEDGKDPAGNARWGRWGLLTNEAFGAQPKPRYQGLKLLDTLSGDQVSLTGNGTWVKGAASKTSTGEITLVLANYDPAAKNSQTVPVTINNLADGEYDVMQQFLGGRQQAATLTATANSLQTQIVMPINSVASITIRPKFAVAPTLAPTPSPSPTPTPRTGFGQLLQNN